MFACGAEPRSIEAGVLLPNAVDFGLDGCRISDNSELPVKGSGAHIDCPLRNQRHVSMGACTFTNKPNNQRP